MVGSNLVHVNAIRVRVVGAGELKPTLLGYNDIISQPLVSITMSATNSREQTRLSNFISQANKLKLETTEENEVMRVNHIWIYVREIYKDFPA
jgi:hypothetical protein